MRTQNGNVYISSHAWTDKTKSHDFFVSHLFRICYVESGSLVWDIDNKSYTVNSGSVVLLNNSEKRRFNKIADNDTLKMLVVEFEPQLLFASVFLPMFLERENGFNHVVNVLENQDIVSAIMDIKHEYLNEQEYYEEIISAKIYNVLALIARKVNLTNSRRMKLSKEMYDVLDYINNHYTEEITLDELADIAHMSSSGFSKAFLRCNGIGVIQYILRRRIGKAIHMLKNTDESVLSIAFECGFNNGASFYKAFGKIAGGTPKSYRKSLENEKKNLKKN